MKILNKIIPLFVLLTGLLSYSQKKEENIGSEVVNVVKPYSPTISDAFKIKAVPTFDEASAQKKEAVKYALFPFPVASTFTPSKGKAEGIEKAKRERLYANYASLGLGNYGVLQADLFVNHELNNNERLSGIFNHHSSQGGIKNLLLKDSFYDTELKANYFFNDNGLDWNAGIDYQNQIYNWYGLPQNFGDSLNETDKNALISSIDPLHSYNSIALSGFVQNDEGVFKDASVNFNHFSDSFGSSENRFYAKPSFSFAINEREIKTKVSLDYLAGSFENNYWKTNLSPIKYGFTNFGLVPSYEFLESDWKLSIGVGVFVSLDAVNDNNQLVVYPKINASYNVVGDLMIFYAGADGDLAQNTYSDFVRTNPFLSPTLNMKPTDKAYDFFVGLKGKLTNTVSYNVRGSYVDEKSKSLFKSNDFSENSSNEAYAFGNSMRVVYDDVKTIRFYGELKADISQDVTFGIDGTFSSYTNNTETEAWNLPTIQLNATANFRIATKWFAGANVFFVGERKDQKSNVTIMNVVALSPITLESYFDVNAHLDYKYDERWTAFLKLNNIANQAYEKWLDYPVQGFQLVVGANYKFDF